VLIASGVDDVSWVNQHALVADTGGRSCLGTDRCATLTDNIVAASQSGYSVAFYSTRSASTGGNWLAPRGCDQHRDPEGTDDIRRFSPKEGQQLLFFCQLGNLLLQLLYFGHRHAQDVGMPGIPIAEILTILFCGIERFQRHNLRHDRSAEYLGVVQLLDVRLSNSLLLRA